MTLVTWPSTSPSTAPPASGASMSTRRALFWRGICEGPWPSVTDATPESGTELSDCDDGWLADDVPPVVVEPAFATPPGVDEPVSALFGMICSELSESSVRRCAGGSCTMIRYWVPLVCQYDAIVPLVAGEMTFGMSVVVRPSCAATRRLTLMSTSGCEGVMLVSGRPMPGISLICGIRSRCAIVYICVMSGP